MKIATKTVFATTPILTTITTEIPTQPIAQSVTLKSVIEQTKYVTTALTMIAMATLIAKMQTAVISAGRCISQEEGFLLTEHDLTAQTHTDRAYQEEIGF